MIARTTNSSIKLNPRLGMGPIGSDVCEMLAFNFTALFASFRFLFYLALESTWLFVLEPLRTAQKHQNLTVRIGNIISVMETSGAGR